jgi:hypothetical protein
MPVLLRLFIATLWGCCLKTQPSGWRLNLLLSLLVRSSDEWMDTQQDVELLGSIIITALRDHYAELPGG